MRIGCQWNVDGNWQARADFHELTSDLLRSAQAGRVIDACHLLAEEISERSSEVVAELIEPIRTARQSLVTEMGVISYSYEDRKS